MRWNCSSPCMNNIYDLTSLIPMEDFPWQEVVLGASKSTKKASIFYGIGKNEHQLTPEQTTWYAALNEGTALKGLDILLTQPRDQSKWNDAWYQLGSSDFWEPSSNMQHFPSLQSWINSINVFAETGRQIIFIQLQNQSTPPHVDQDPRRAPPGYQDPTEFLWITSARGGKQLIVHGQTAPHVCWFNSYVSHHTLAAPGLRWSLRIDGRFTEQFKEKLNTV